MYNATRRAYEYPEYTGVAFKTMTAGELSVAERRVPAISDVLEEELERSGKWLEEERCMGRSMPSMTKHLWIVTERRMSMSKTSHSGPTMPACPFYTGINSDSGSDYRSFWLTDGTKWHPILNSDLSHKRVRGNKGVTFLAYTACIKGCVGAGEQRDWKGEGCELPAGQTIPTSPQLYWQHHKLFWQFNTIQMMKL